jgi:Bacteriophage tail tube protein
MTNLVINSLWNCNVYLNGNNLLGRAAEFTVPQPLRKMQAYSGLGMMSGTEIPVGWEKMEATIKWASFDQTTLGQLMSSTGMQQFAAMGDLQVLSSSGETNELPIVYNLTGLTKDPGKVMFKAQENIGYDTTITVYHIDLTIAGTQVYMFDVFSNQFVVNGVDQLATYRANIGG